MASISTQQGLAKEIRNAVNLPPIPWTERYFSLLWGVMGVLGCVRLGQIGAATGLLDPLFVSSPVEVIRTALGLIPSKEFGVPFVLTAECLVVGLLISVI